MMTIANNGQVFTQEKFQEDPGAAQEFLDIFASNSFGILPHNWTEQTEDQIIQEASYRLFCLDRDLSIATHLRHHDELQ